MKILPLLLLLILLPCVARAQSVTANSTTRYVLTTTHPVSVTVSGGPGNPRDFVVVGKAGFVVNEAYFSVTNWKYLNNLAAYNAPANGLTSGTVTFTVAEPGNYEARFYALPPGGTIATAKLLKNIPFVVDPLTELELLDYSGATITRRPDDTLDQITVTTDGTTAVVTTAKGSKVTLNGKPVP
jgi:uncharacterized membrane protein